MCRLLPWLGLWVERDFSNGLKGLFCKTQGAVSSAVERLVYTELVGGSIPSLPTILIINHLLVARSQSNTQSKTAFAAVRVRLLLSKLVLPWRNRPA